MIKKGIIKGFNPADYTATVQIVGSLSVWLQAVPVSHAIPPSEMLAGRTCAVLFLDESNPNDAIVFAVVASTPILLRNTAWELIETKTLTAAASTIDFTNIPTDFNAFRMTIFCQRTYPGVLSIALRFNDDSGPNYDIREILASGSTVTTTTFMSYGYAVVATVDSTHFAPSVVWIQNLEAGTEKDYISIAGVGANQFRHLSGRWNNTTQKITKISLLALIPYLNTGSKVILEGTRQ